MVRRGTVFGTDGPGEDEEEDEEGDGDGAAPNDAEA